MNEFNFAVTGTERKKLVGVISELTNSKITYNGAPTFSYDCGGYHIDKTGVVTGEYDLNLFVGLAERGFEPEISPIPAEESDEPEVIPVVDETADTAAHGADSEGIIALRLPDEVANRIFEELSPEKAAEPIQFSTPRGIFTVEKVYQTREEAEADDYGIYFTHEAHDVYIKPNPQGITEHSKLFALVGEPLPQPEEPAAYESDRLTVEVPNDFTPEQIDNIAKMVAAKKPLLKKALVAEELPIRVTDEKVAFPWFTLDKPENAAYYVQFIYALCKTAKEKKRVTAKAPEAFENEKFSMRVWLISLKMIGKEYGNARKLLGKALSGDSGWRYGKPEKQAETAPEASESEVQGDA